MSHGTLPEGSGHVRPTVSIDTILDLLSHRHRRALLFRLRDARDQTLSEEEVIGFLQRRDARRSSRQSRKRLATMLHHTHRPKLSEAGVVSYDEREKTYRYHGEESLESWLDHMAAAHGIP